MHYYSHVPIPATIVAAQVYEINLRRWNRLFGVDSLATDPTKGVSWIA